MKKYFLDTNILLLLLVGRAHPDWLGKRKPVSDLDDLDYRNLIETLADDKGFVTLPYVLAETSNLIGFGKRNSATKELHVLFQRFMKTCEELSVDSEPLISDDAMFNHGLTDFAILSLVRGGVVTITEDFALFGKLSSLGLPVQNLRHKRPI